MLNKTKIAIISAVSNILWFIVMFFWKRPSAAILQGEELAKAWGVYLLVLVAGFLVADVLIAIFVMAREKRSGGQGFDEVTDERDRHIEGYAMKAFALVFFVLFVVSLILLALGKGLDTFFCALSFTVLISALAMWISYIIGYERGL